MKSYIFIIALFIISILMFSACSRQERFIAEAKLNSGISQKVARVLQTQAHT